MNKPYVAALNFARDCSPTGTRVLYDDAVGWPAQMAHVPRSESRLWKIHVP